MSEIPTEIALALEILKRELNEITSREQLLKRLDEAYKRLVTTEKNLCRGRPQRDEQPPKALSTAAEAYDKLVTTRENREREAFVAKFEESPNEVIIEAIITLTSNVSQRLYMARELFGQPGLAKE